MTGSVKEVAADLIIRANFAAAHGPRGYEYAMVSIVQALSKEASGDDLLAVTYRLQALANLHQGDDDIPGLTMNVQGKDYKLINEAAFKAAAVCPLSLAGTMDDFHFDQEQFATSALSFTDPEGTA